MWAFSPVTTDPGPIKLPAGVLGVPLLLHLNESSFRDRLMHPIFVLISNTCTSYTRILSLLACTFYHLDIVYVLKNILNQLLVVPRRKQSLVAFEPPTPQWRGRSYWQRPSYGHLMIATSHFLIDNIFLKVHFMFVTSHTTKSTFIQTSMSYLLALFGSPPM